jgi:hypothetical protein
MPGSKGAVHVRTFDFPFTIMRQAEQLPIAQ